ncbi:LOW QUALITY PROTEIN: hypothetical protein PHMEG_00012093 [Phytophthora megakarya]|uniref:Uncharacterized protein n=1 Tax=Phytophthora megakarya TaxID=4795 RepID=A0A225WBA8_9STRA|nr:LOW QUALITY PROTEIN: hypothetical protein PHMEG_00012093 [Phytophthora megakarya]
MSASLRTPAFSSVSVLTVASTPAPVPASASVPASIPLSGTTEKNFSLDKYFELQEKKFELEAKQRAGGAKTDSPRTDFDGSSSLSTDGGIPLDYEEGGLEDEGTSSSQSYDSKPAAGTRRPREDDSDASPSNRPRIAFHAGNTFHHLGSTCCSVGATWCPHTDDSVREPWMPSDSVITARYGCTVPPNEIPLYVDNRIVDDAEVASKHFEPMTNQRRDYYISLFHELRYWSSKKTSGRSRVPEWQALCQSWNQFVENFNKDSTAYRDRTASARERFMKYSITSVVQRVHEVSENANTPRAVPVGVHCPPCPPGAPRISERDLTGYTTNRVPANVKELRAKLVPSSHAHVISQVLFLTPTLRETLRPAELRLQSVVGFVRLHHFRNVRHKDPSGKPRISKETRLPPTNTKTNRTSVRLRTGMVNNLIHLAVDQTADRVMLLSAVSDAHHMVNLRLTTSIHARVEALESVQAVQIAELKQQLNLQIAYVAEAAHTTSNISRGVRRRRRVITPRWLGLHVGLQAPNKLQLHHVQIERLLVVPGQSPLLES